MDAPQYGCWAPLAKILIEDLLMEKRTDEDHREIVYGSIRLEQFHIAKTYAHEFPATATALLLDDRSIERRYHVDSRHDCPSCVSSTLILSLRPLLLKKQSNTCLPAAGDLAFGDIMKRRMKANVLTQLLLVARSRTSSSSYDC